MIFVHAYKYYLLGCYVHVLTAVTKAMHFGTALKQMGESYGQLGMFVDSEEEKVRLPGAVANAGIILGLIDGIYERAKKIGYQYFTEEDETSFRNAVRDFEAVLNTELGSLPLFCVERKGNLSIERLLRGASSGYAQKAQKHMPEFTRDEIDEAGQCLALGMSTASGFHILRAAEYIIRRFAVATTGAEPKKRDWGHYIELLAANGADDKILAPMRQINNLYRKPLMHPEDILTDEEGINLFCVCQSAIEALIEHMAVKGYFPAAPGAIIGP